MIHDIATKGQPVHTEEMCLCVLNAAKNWAAESLRFSINHALR